MSAFVSATIYKILVGLVHLWITDRYLKDKILPPSAVSFYVDSSNMQWGDELLKDKRIRVTFEIEQKLRPLS